MPYETQYDDGSDYSFTKPDYSLSGDSGSSYGGIDLKDVSYTPSDGIKVSGGGEGLDVNDYVYKPGEGFVYTGGGGTGSGMSFSGVDADGSPISVRAPDSVLGGLGGLLKSFGNLVSGKQKIGGDNGVGLDQLMSLFLMAKVLGGGKGFMAPQPVGHQGGIRKYAATRTQIPQPAYVPYSGQAVMGGKQLSDVQYAAKGGIMGLRNGAFVIPADVVSHFGNGSSEAGMEFLQKKLGATPIKGKGDGMSDSIDTTIDGKQPAKVAHEEAIVSPEKVAALGKGDPKKGAKVLYAMMDRVRKARTGTTKQGKQINPEKFTPGGIAGYAGGGAVAFNGTTGSSVTNPSAGSSTTSNLSEWAGPYVTDMLGQAQALSNQPYQAYQGPLTAGYSPLQQQAFAGYGNFQMPSAIGQAAQTQGNLANRLSNMSYGLGSFANQFQGPGDYQTGQFNAGYGGIPSYQATQFGNQFQGPSQYQTGIFANQFQGPSAYQTGQFTNQFAGTGAYTPTTATAGFNAPGAYQGVDFSAGLTPQNYQAGQFANQFQGPGAYQAGQFNTGLGPVGSVQSYMSPYTQGVTDIEAREARRQADITGAAQQAKMAQAGAFGGSRDAIMRAELARNLGTQIGDITARGLNTAYDKALSQRLAESQASMEAQKAGEASRQFGAQQGMTGAQLAAQYGLAGQQLGEQSRQFGAQQGMQGLQMLLDARRAAEASRQFGAGQAMTGAQLGAQFGLQAQQQTAQERQFAAQQRATADQLRAQFGLSAQQAQEASRQFGAGQALTAAQLQAQYGLSAQQAAEASRQFGSQQGMTAAQLRAQYGLAGQQAQEQAQQYGYGQMMTAQDRAAQYRLQAQQAQEASRQFGAGQGMTAAQLRAQYGLSAQQASEASRQFGANFGLQGLQAAQQAAQAQGQLGYQQGQLGLQSLAAQLGAGEQQRAIEQQGIAARQAEFEKQRLYPYQQLQFQQSMLQGLPISTYSNMQNTSGLQDLSAIIDALRGLGSTTAEGRPPV